MKRIALIFLLFCFCGINHIQAKSEYIFSAESISSLNKIENGFIKNLPGFHSSAIDAGNLDDHLSSKKGKRRKKALLPVVIPSPTESCLIIVTIEIELVCTPKTFYFFRPNFAHGERGPPLCLLVS